MPERTGFLAPSCTLVRLLGRTQRHQPVNHPDRYRWEAMDRPAAPQMVYPRRLMESRPHILRAPDDRIVVCTNGEGAHHLSATRAAYGSYAMVDVPDAVHTVTVDLGKVSGACVQAWFYNTHTGLA